MERRSDFHPAILPASPSHTPHYPYFIFFFYILKHLKKFLMYNFCWFCEESKTRKNLTKNTNFFLGENWKGGCSRAQGGERERTHDVGGAGSEGDPTGVSSGFSRGEWFQLTPSTALLLMTLDVPLPLEGCDCEVVFWDVLGSQEATLQIWGRQDWGTLGGKGRVTIGILELHH